MSKYLLALFLMLITNAAFANTPIPTIDDSTVLNIVQQAMAPAADKLLSISLIWFTTFVSIQFVVTNFGLLKSGADMEAVIGKLIGSLFWTGFCIYVLENGPAFIGSVGQEFFNMLGAGLPSVGAIISSTLALTSALTVAAVSVGVASNTGGQFVLYLIILFFSIGMFFAIKIFMVQLELGLIIMLSPMSFSFLGLNALKDQGIAPFKSLISLGYRILLMTIVLSAFTEVHNVMLTSIKNFGTLEYIKIYPVINVILAGLTSYVLLGYLLFKSDSIASSLAGGHTNMGTGDVAAAGAAGAAASSAIGSGGQAGIKPIQSMGDFMKSLPGGGAISDASSSGSGGKEPIGSPPARPASSLGEPIGNVAPVRPESASDSSSTPSELSPLTEPSQPPSAGNDATAGISGGGGNLEKQLGQLVDSMNKPKNPTFGERLGEANRHVSQESAATHVSINGHADN